MITADKLTLLTNMPAVMLEMSLPAKKRPQLKTARFLGLTNAYEFCYAVTLADGSEDKVFVGYDPTLDKVFGKMS